MEIGSKWRSRHTGNVFTISQVEKAGTNKEVVYFKDAGGSEHFMYSSTFKNDCEPIDE